MMADDSHSTCIRERHVEIEVKVIAEGRYPLEVPTHSPSQLLDFLNRSAGHHRIRQIVVLEMHANSGKVVDLQRTSQAMLGLPGTHHEMFDEQLAAPVEELRQRHRAGRSVEYVVFLNPDPR